MSIALQADEAYMKGTAVCLRHLGGEDPRNAGAESRPDA